MHILRHILKEGVTAKKTVTFNEHKDEAYKTNFDVITFQKIFESTFTSTK